MPSARGWRAESFVDSYKTELIADRVWRSNPGRSSSQHSFTRNPATYSPSLRGSEKIAAQYGVMLFHKSVAAMLPALVLSFGSTALAKAQTVPTLPYTTLVWSDNFSGPAGSTPSSSNWTQNLGGGGWGNDELETYTNSTANSDLTGSDQLAITALKTTTNRGGGRHGGGGGSSSSSSTSYTSARLVSKASYTYGLFEANMEIPAGTGLWPAFWMLGANINTVGWPECGEIDAMETIDQDPFTVYGTIHGPDGNSSTDYPGDGLGVSDTTSTNLSSGFHTYSVQWSPNSVTWYLDGVSYGTVTSSDLTRGESWVLNAPENLILNLAVGGDWPGSPNSSTHFPAKLLVNWVKVYQ